MHIHTTWKLTSLVGLEDIRNPNTIMPSTVKQWVTAQDGLDKLRMAEADMPTPGDKEVLVEIHAVSLNYRDTEGWKTFLLGFPFDRVINWIFDIARI